MPFDFAQGTPSKVEGWRRGPRGPSTLLRAIPSKVEGWRAPPCVFDDRPLLDDAEAVSFGPCG